MRKTVELPGSIALNYSSHIRMLFGPIKRLPNADQLQYCSTAVATCMIPVSLLEQLTCSAITYKHAQKSQPKQAFGCD